MLEECVPMITLLTRNNLHMGITISTFTYQLVVYLVTTSQCGLFYTSSNSSIPYSRFLLWIQTRMKLNCNDTLSHELGHS